MLHPTLHVMSQTTCQLVKFKLPFYCLVLMYVSPDHTQLTNLTFLCLFYAKKKKRLMRDKTVGCMLTLGRNYSNLVCSSPGLGQYLTPWRVPAFQRGRERNYSAHLDERQKGKSSSSIQGEYTAEWPQSLWIKKSRSVSTSGLRRDGLSSCCCCQRLVQKKDKVMEGEDGQERHKHKEEFTPHISDFKVRKSRPLLCLLLRQCYTSWRSKEKRHEMWWKRNKLQKNKSNNNKKTNKTSHICWMFTDYLMVTEFNVKHCHFLCCLYDVFFPQERKNPFKFLSAIWQEHWRIKETFESNLNCNVSVRNPIYGISS